MENPQQVSGIKVITAANTLIKESQTPNSSGSGRFLKQVEQEKWPTDKAPYKGSSLFSSCHNLTGTTLAQHGPSFHFLKKPLSLCIG